MIRKLLVIFLLSFCVFDAPIHAVIGEDTTHGYVQQDTPFLDEEVSPEELMDPFEPFNRFIFHINMGLDIMFIRPLAELYATLFPSPLRKGISNALGNVKAPLILINDILQLKFDRAGNTFMRFLINSTLGIGGLFDFATDMGFPHHNEDFGQTLGHYGVGAGPYLMLPLLGPSNIRDAVGTGVDGFINPFRLVMFGLDLPEVYYGHLGGDGLSRRTNARSLTDRIQKMEDPYIQYRKLYLQNRNYRLNDESVDTQDLPGADADDDEDLEELE